MRPEHFGGDMRDGQHVVSLCGVSGTGTLFGVRVMPTRTGGVGAAVGVVQAERAVRVVVPAGAVVPAVGVRLPDPRGTVTAVRMMRHARTPSRTTPHTSRTS